MDSKLLEIWKAKLAAWLHDPPEKALILQRTEEGHEGGTATVLYEFCFGEGKDPQLRRLAEVADRWAAASDRPQWPIPKEEPNRDRTILFWSRKGAKLIHPLGGDVYDLGDLYVAASGRIVAASASQMLALLGEATEDLDFDAGAEVPEGGARAVALPLKVLRGAGIPAELGKEEAATLDALRRAVFALWRLGPITDPEGLELGEVWRLLPADSRVPDHSIWEHNALASAIAGALAADPEESPALLLVSLGPVQGFIEQARTTSDLWAGSHLLSCLAWEAMKPVVERYGPDAIIFPSLWGVPLVDVWLEEQGLKLPEGDQDRRSPVWKHAPTDANPLFSPCLPNRFVALVPASEAEKLAKKISRDVRGWALKVAGETASTLCELAGVDSTEGVQRQVEEQLAEFPEVYWAAVPFRPLVEWRNGPGGGEGTLDVEALKKALGVFCGSDKPGFFGTQFWRVLNELPKARQDAGPEAGAEYLRYPLNPGTVYPAFVELAERVLAASKATRTFSQTRQEGYRCSVCGEREWLRGPGDDQPTPAEEAKVRPRRKFELPVGQRGETLWSKLHEKDPRLVKKGEHLCALCATKRLWPRRFAEMAGEWVQGRQEAQAEGTKRISRFVVSTHTMALAPDLARLPLASKPGESPDDFQRRREAFEELVNRAKNFSHEYWSVLPKKLAEDIAAKSDDVKTVCRVLPALFDRAKEAEAGEGGSGAATVSREELERLWKQAFGFRPETYYGLILMDGDQAGKWLSGDPELMLKLRELWHPELAGWLLRRHPRPGDWIHDLLEAPRPASPGYHAALSGAMNNFAMEIARWVVEELFLGRLIYSGGDDALAMVAVDDLLPCMFALRCAFSGIVPAGEKDAVLELYRQLGSHLGNIDRGYVKVRNRLLRALGGRMTASMGAVVAHHEAPLQAVLRRLREAERAAKANGRNSFSIVVSKRGGGETAYTASWGFGGVVVGNGTEFGPRDIAYEYEPGKWSSVSGQDLVTPIGVLLRLRETLALPFVSRRAVYHTLEWLAGLPAHPECPTARLSAGEYRTLLVENLAYQFQRQGVRTKNYEDFSYKFLIEGDPDPARTLAEAVTTVALRQCQPWGDRKTWRCVPDHLREMLVVAEFLAREGRALPPKPEKEQGGEA